MIRQIHSDVVEIVDIDDLCENGILYETEKIPQVVEKFKKAGIDALFTPHCDFGEEQCAAGGGGGPEGAHPDVGRPGRAAQHGREPGPGTPSAACSPAPR